MSVRIEASPRQFSLKTLVLVVALVSALMAISIRNYWDARSALELVHARHTPPSDLIFVLRRFQYVWIGAMLAAVVSSFFLKRRTNRWALRLAAVWAYLASVVNALIPLGII